MADGLWSRIKEGYKSSRERVNQRERESEIELHPEKRHWDERLWQMEDYFKDLTGLTCAAVASPVFSFLTGYAHNSDFNNAENIFGLGTIVMTCSFWHFYRRIRNNPYYELLRSYRRIKDSPFYLADTNFLGL